MKRLIPYLFISGIAFTTMPLASTPFSSPAKFKLVPNPQPVVHAQENSTQERRQESEEKYGDIVLSPDQVVVRRYVPQELERNELSRILRDLRGRLIYNVNSSNGYPNITTLADAILIRDQAEAVQEILDLAEELDHRLGKPARPDLRILEFVPRFISLESAQQVLAPFQHSVRDPRTNEKLSNWNSVEQRNMIILRDEPEQVAEMLELLTSLDVPEAQVRLRVWIAIGDPENMEISGLPGDLVDDLTNLLPGFGFRSDGLSIVQTSVAVGRSVDLEIEGEEQDYSVLLRPTAYDPDSGRLTLGRLQLGRRSRPQNGGSTRGPSQVGQQRMLFSTSAVLNAGDYTVLGASGRTPVFLIVKVDPLGNRSRSQATGKAR